MRLLIVLVVLALAGCSARPAGPNLSQILNECGANTKPFVEYWPCIKAGLSSPDENNPDVKALYLATGDYVAEQVSAGKMTEAEASLAMAEARQRASSTVQARQNAASGAASARMAAWNSTRPRTCVQHGYIVNCY